MTPTIITESGVLGDRAVADLRKAGYCVVRASDANKVREFYPVNFENATTRAKLKTIEYFMGGGGAHCITRDNLNHAYIEFLKKEGAF